MANNENLIPIPGRLHSVATEGHVSGANEIYDDTQQKDQETINADVAEDISNLQEIVGEGSVDTRIENAIKALDAEKSQTAGADGLALSITETDGKITSISGSIATDTYDSYGSASAAQEAAATDATTKVNTAKAELLGDAATDYNTLGKLEDAIQSEASTRETEIGTDSTAGSVKGRIKSLETLVGSTDVDSQIDVKINALDSTKSQTAGADGLALSIEEEDGKIKSISGSIAANTYDAYGAASTAKSDLLGDAASDYNTLGKLEDAIQAEATTRSGETEALDGRLDNIEEVIPSAATSSNQLADKSFVNSSISTATAEYQGSYNSVSDLSLSVSATHSQIATALGTEISGADNNDYCFVQIPTADVTPTDIAKVERYKYNGTAWSFEYELNNSGYTDAQWAAINSGITSNLVTAFGNKYDKPSTGIPSTDMTSDVQTSLGKADSAYQKPSGGIPDSDLTSAVQTSLGKADTAYQKPSEGIPSSDLADGVIPDISGKANKSEMSVVDGTDSDADKTTITLKDGTSATVLKSHQDISGKQDVIDSTHKLDADLIDDTSSTNKFTNATEKQIWNAKQDALTFNTTPSADNKVATMTDIEYATENCAYLEEGDSSAAIADFDPQADTVWKKAQVLSNAEKAQVKTNLGLPQEIYSKTEVNGLITTPNQQYVTVPTFAFLPATGSVDTIYRVSNYNGSTDQVDATMYSEYAWNGSFYTFLCVKSQVGEVFDITAYNSNTKYADLSAALGTNGVNIPESLRRGGMSVKFVQNSDNKYVQFRYMSSLTAAADFTNIANWQGVDDEPTAGSDNLVKSGGVYEMVNQSGQMAHNGEYVIKNKAISYYSGDNPYIVISNAVNYDIFMIHIPVNMSVRKIKITGISSVNRLHFFDSSAFDNFTPEHWISKYDSPEGVTIDIPLEAQVCAFGVEHSSFPNGYNGIDVQITTEEDLTTVQNNILQLQGDVRDLQDDVRDLQLDSVHLYLASIDSNGEFAPAPSGTTSYSRAACRTYIKSPITIEVNSGYMIYFLYKYQISADGEISFIESISVQNNMAVIKEDGYYYRMNFKKNEGNITSTELDDIIKSVSGVDMRLADLEQDVSSDFLSVLKAIQPADSDYISCTPILEVGNIAISSSGWNYTNNFTRVRTKDGVTIPLKKGDIIRLTDYTDAKMYIGWRRSIGTYRSSGAWLTQDFTVTEDGDYVVNLSNITAKSASVDGLGSLLQIQLNSSVLDRFNKLDESLKAALESIYNGNAFSLTNSTLAAETTITELHGASKIKLIKGVSYNWNIKLTSSTTVKVSFWLRHIDDTEHDARIILEGTSEDSTSFIAPETADYYINYRFKEDSSDMTIESMSIETPENINEINNALVSNNRTDYAQGVLFGRPYYSHFLVAERDTVATNKIIAPSQSLFDIEVSARLGFSYIELNAHKTSDGKFVCFHGTGGKFDNQFELSDNPTGLFATTADFKTIEVRQVTLADIQASIRNRAKYAKYCTAPNTLEECLLACKKNGIRPLVSFNADTAPVINSIMGKDDYIGYIGGPSKITQVIRSLTDAMLFVYDDSSQSLVDVYDNADALGGAVLYDSTYADNANDSVTQEYVETMHEKGYLVCGVPNYRNEAWNQKALSLGYDALCSGWNINPIKNGNICELYADIDYSDFTHNGSVSDGELILANGNTVSPNFQIPSVFIGGGYLEIKFNGTLTIIMGDKINLSVTSNNDDVHIFSSAFFESAPTFQLTSSGNTTIKGMTFKASRL